MGYLDNKGLAHLWSKIKTALSGKQDILAGEPGQVVGFGLDGVAVPQAIKQIYLVKEQMKGQEEGGFACDIDGSFAQDMLIYAKCELTGFTFPGILGSRYHLPNAAYGMLHVSANIRGTAIRQGIPVHINIQPEFENLRVVLLKSSTLRILTFQGSFASTDSLQGVYCDIRVDQEDIGTDIKVTITPAQPIIPNYTFWIEFQTPVFFEMA